MEEEALRKQLKVAKKKIDPFKIYENLIIAYHRRRNARKKRVLLYADSRAFDILKKSWGGYHQLSLYPGYPITCIDSPEFKSLEFELKIESEKKSSLANNQAILESSDFLEIDKITSPIRQIFFDVYKKGCFFDQGVRGVYKLHYNDKITPTGQLEYQQQDQIIIDSWCANKPPEWHIRQFKSISDVPTKKTVNLNLFSEDFLTIGGDPGDIRISVQNLGEGRHILPKKVKFEVRDGGVISINDSSSYFNYTAPDTGYSPTVEMIIDNSIFNQSFYYTARNGTVYGKLAIKMRIFGDAIQYIISTTLNPWGSRYLYIPAHAEGELTRIRLKNNDCALPYEQRRACGIPPKTILNQ